MMIQILTCENCHRTSATTAKVKETDFPREGSWLIWYCSHCAQTREWLIPSGRSVEDAARQSRRSSSAFKNSAKREDLYKRLRAARPEMRAWLLFGELIWWWREEAKISQLQAAARAKLSNRHWERIEAGESKLRDKNLEGVVRAACGHMGQAYLVVKPGERWGKKFKRRLEMAEKQ